MIMIMVHHGRWCILMLVYQNNSWIMIIITIAIIKYRLIKLHKPVVILANHGGRLSQGWIWFLHGLISWYCGSARIGTQLAGRHPKSFPILDVPRRYIIWTQAMLAMQTLRRHWCRRLPCNWSFTGFVHQYLPLQKEYHSCFWPILIHPSPWSKPLIAQHHCEIMINHDEASCRI